MWPRDVDPALSAVEWNVLFLGKTRNFLSNGDEITAWISNLFLGLKKHLANVSHCRNHVRTVN